MMTEPQELITLMTGLLTELNFSSDNGTVEITISGEQQLLINSNAEAVSTTSSNENIGTGNASKRYFLRLIMALDSSVSL